MIGGMTVERVMSAYWSALDAADWDAMADLLADGFLAEVWAEEGVAPPADRRPA
jgi:hypothetical protein